MSQKKYVDYGEPGFWAYDVALGVFLKYLIDAAEARPRDADTPWLAAAVSEWRVAACMQDVGLSLDETWSPPQIAVFTTLVETACSRLAEREAIAGAEVAGWPVLGDERIFLRGAGEVLTAPVVELGRAVIQLVGGSLPPDPAGGFYIYGTPSGRRSYPPPPQEDA